MKRSRLPFCLFLLLAVCASLLAKNRTRDPLTYEETNQLRDVADEPAKKIALYIKFINQRMDNLDHLRSDTRHVQDRGRRMHDLLEDFVNLSDEMGDNIDDDAEKNVDLRKVLIQLISSNGNWQKVVETLKQAQNDSKAADDSSDYEFVLNDALDAVKNNNETYTALLEKQNVDIPRLEKEAKEREKK